VPPRIPKRQPLRRLIRVSGAALAGKLEGQIGMGGSRDTTKTIDGHRPIVFGENGLIGDVILERLALQEARCRVTATAGNPMAALERPVVERSERKASRDCGTCR